MKRKAGLTLLALACATTVFAQKGVEDGSRYGQGQDSINCLKNISIYTEYVKTENYKDAYENGWKEVFRDAPLAQTATYTNGVKILRALYKAETDAAQKAQYSKELMEVYEQRLKYLDQLNSFVKNPTPEEDVIGQYAHDYIAYNPKPELQKAYELCRKAVTMAKENSLYYVLDDLMKISAQRYKSNKDTRDDLFQDYVDCSTYIVPVIAAQTNEKIIEQAEKIKENIDGYFINSGAADCDNLQDIYGPKIEENKDNLEYLNKVVTLMSKLKCTSSDAYFSAAEYAHAISPSAKTAESLGRLYLAKRNDQDKAIEYFEQALEIADEGTDVADVNYMIAVIYNQKSQRAKAKTYLQKAMTASPNRGDLYILLAQMYASDYQWSSQAALNQCTFYAVIDKLEKARQVDSSVADKAAELIREYSKHTPKAEDLFMLSIKKGDQVKIEGWINETTTVR